MENLETKSEENSRSFCWGLKTRKRSGLDIWVAEGRWGGGSVIGPRSFSDDTLSQHFFLDLFILCV